MALKNYTSKVPISRSISFIEGKLVQHGARSIMKDYDDDGEISSVCFIIPMNDREVPFKLPAKVGGVE